MLYVREPEHGPEFRARMKRVLPDREQREAWLMGNGAELVV
jgi:predicted metal-dependent hydrolase